MKKILKIVGITLLIIITLLIAIPFIFQSQIKEMVKTFINENVNAKVEFSDVNLSLLSSFPKANVTVNDLVITNYAPFNEEVFAEVKELSFNMSVKELFKNASEDPIVINSIKIDEALLTLKTNKNGDVNYDIAKKDDNEKEINTDTTQNENGFSLDIKNYSINNSVLTFIDESSNTYIYITELNHSGKGTFSAKQSELDTHTDAKISFKTGGKTYLSNTLIKLDALIGLDLSSNTYTFKENKAFINQLPLEFQGYVKQLENAQDIDITFKNPESSFKDFLAVIPAAYSKNISDVKTTGNFTVIGKIKGLLSENTIPNLDINITSHNASFKYPDLPKQVENITINASIKNDTGNADDTYIAINTLNFKIDDDVFKSSVTLKNLTKNMLINAHIDGILNLANIEKAYPIKLDHKLSGILKGKLNTSFDMNAITTNAYNRIKNNGFITVNDFVFSSEDIVNPIHISEANIQFKSSTVNLKSFNATTGTSDLKVTGTLKNLLGFLLSDNKLQGDFNVYSNTFAVSDFMVENKTNSENNKTSTDSESLKIPAFLDCTINANVKTVLYDNLSLKDVKGVMVIKDEKATLKNMTTNMFGGNMAITGDINTKGSVPQFNLDLLINNFDISQSFNGLELFQSMAPIARALQGKLNATINLSGTLDEELSPKLNSITGDAFTELLSAKINPEKTEVLNQLSGALNFIDFTKLDLKDLKTKLEFNDGKVTIKPFNLTYDDIEIEISGSHSFENIMSYNAVFNVPAKYLGSDVNRLIGKIDDNAVNNLTIPVTAYITGTYNKPTIKTDLTSGVASLTTQLIEIQKQKLLNEGTDQLTGLIGNVLSGNSKETDSTATQQNNAVNDVIGDFLGETTKSTDSTKASSTENAIKGILGGILGKKKKTKKDTVN